MAFWRATIRRSLVTYMDLRRINVAEMDDSALRVLTSEAIDRIIQDQADLDADIDREELARQVLAEAVGLGPLEPLIADDSISEIMVNSRDEIFYEKSGVLQKSEVTFTDDSAVVSAIERIVSSLGRRIDESSPMVDARLKDGSRVNAVIPPLALKGPNITIRKFMKERLTSDHLLRFGSMDEKMVEFLELAVEQKKNILISGGTGSGKTTLLNVLSNFIPDGERIITVEDAAELKLYQPNLISLEARPSNQEGKGEVTIRDLVKNCLRMRPDRIVVGECRGGEALDMLQAMNTGHDGSLTTIHANTPRDCLSRIEVLVLMSGMELPVQAIREQITSAIDIIVQQTRFSCGSRKVTSITEVNGIEAGVIQLSEIFRFAHSGYGPDGKVSGEFVSTGNVPDFVEGLRQRNVKIDMRLFNNVHQPQDPGHGF
ncbi:MAG: CpaF family protein [Pseudomonadales bacterium]|nr:CpaF family protein [Pseudomonadales bacterium]